VIIFTSKSSEVMGSPSQIRHLKSPGLKCELVAGLEMYKISPANHRM
jgi:hypothetical protein